MTDPKPPEQERFLASSRSRPAKSLARRTGGWMTVVAGAIAALLWPFVLRHLDAWGRTAGGSAPRLLLPFLALVVVVAFLWFKPLR